MLLQQVSEKLRVHPRVHLMERTNMRYLVLEDLPDKQQVDIATLDLSFISLLTVMPALCGILRPGAELVTLIKPQFEAARHQVPATSRLPIQDLGMYGLSAGEWHITKSHTPPADGMFMILTCPCASDLISKLWEHACQSIDCP